MKHIISVLMENKVGALSRVVGLFSARGYNIDSLSVSPTENINVSRLTLVTFGDASVIEQIIKQLNKLIDVIKVMDCNKKPFAARELILLKLKVNSSSLKEEILRLSQIYRARVIDVAKNSYTIELTGSSNKIDSFINIIGIENIVETVRTGEVGIGRGENILVRSK